jgi:ribosomal-protein-alanine N-acetyltransferase
MELPYSESERLILRSLTVNDAEELYKFRVRNAEFFKPWSPTYPADYFNPDYHRKNLIQIESDVLKGILVQFGVYLKTDSKKIIGSVVFSNIIMGPFKSCYLGYRIDKDDLNKGYATEAIIAGSKYMFTEKKLHRIEANIIPRNIASIKTIEKAGFTYEGISKKYLKINGVWEDHLHYVLLNNEIE